tara:strand:- start:308 stop:478 length:171 start_codon:yes stop_codon:yes gene_type:complete
MISIKTEATIACAMAFTHRITQLSGLIKSARSKPAKRHPPVASAASAMINQVSETE